MDKKEGFEKKQHHFVCGYLIKFVIMGNLLTLISVLHFFFFLGLCFLKKKIK